MGLGRCRSGWTTSAWSTSAPSSRERSSAAAPTLAQFWSLTWLQVRERIIAAGSPGEVVDDGRAALEDASRWFHGPATVIAWGRRAAG